MVRFIHIVFLSFCCLALFGCASTSFQGKDSLACINIIDQNGLSETFQTQDRLEQYGKVDFLSPQPYQKVMRIYRRDYRGSIRAVITGYHPNGQIKQYLEIINNSANGVYREWHETGQLKLDALVISGTADIGPSAEESWQFDGLARAWDEAGCLSAEIPYKLGRLEGISRYYHPNGKIKKTASFQSGTLEGKIELFSADEDLLLSVEYKNGIRDGRGHHYWKDGQLAASEDWHQGKLENAKYTDQQGNIICQVESGAGFAPTIENERITELHEIYDGVPEGLVKVFDENDNLYITYYVKDSLKHGEEIEYYVQDNKDEKQLLRLSINWVEGKIQGAVRTWYPNGKQESQREMSENAKNGIATAWYEDGSLMLIEEYEKEILSKGKYFKKGEKIPLSKVIDGRGTATLYDQSGNFLRKIDYQNGRPLQ